MKIHEKYIKRCIEIGKNGLGTTRPNPMVGCVIVHNNTIIGEGFTSPYGGNHAEVNAINSVKNKTLLKNATLYVTLEPCSHYGKTPPCSDLIINYQIPDVVIGCMDDNENVAGKGIKRLMEAGCRVTVGIMESECRIHHKRFFTFHNKKRPYLILKWAETKNGFMAPKVKFEQKPIWITNRLSRQLVHKWRAEEHAILIGANTVFQDNPTLTVRNWSGQHPIRIVLDKNNALTNTYHVFNDHSETLVIREISAKSICEKLYNHNINSVIIEGGTKTLQLFIDANLWDEARVFTGKISFENGALAPRFYGNLISEVRIDTDILKIYRND
ncbi:bifunctional diaminohydroxyphosphoribosylaminopyrimidine deaminase/5-amino-6-(5-phosphoribosylamino)uracil reductase RibD [Aestuariivivens sediminis]|uniref:bifunctional diaminohydroxyphosphoribosylaminopyrimidine deaminase/5-amino-6-(5-phosphoribosylamino)uracil reductase RibD n=1 Tax=Aestuariivivens sediminis TaxID=2913557 RepID=UPI001F560E55|nr:bifunctional diaminohydroxyphosphoribosylaminopyrimidine deaminase/5-amino-6-(5-phosphoribosylamino)uracil reductase RibD [Aestuariivivens sediminis]